MEFEVNLSDVLSEMGLQAAFKGYGQFLQMSEDPDVHIDRVIHKAVVEVNEEGTVAAAATVVAMKTRCMPRPELEITLDRPFVFVIEHIETKDLLFVGVVNCPDLG